MQYPPDPSPSDPYSQTLWTISGMQARLQLVKASLLDSLAALPVVERMLPPRSPRALTPPRSLDKRTLDP